MRSAGSHQADGPTHDRQANAQPHCLYQHFHTTHQRPTYAISTYHTTWYTITSHKMERAVRQTQKRDSLCGVVQFKWTCEQDESSRTKELVQKPSLEDFYTIYIVCKGSSTEKNGDRSPAWSFGWTCLEEHDMRIDSRSRHQLWTHAQARPK